MIKNHTEGEIAKARIALNEKKFLFLQNISAITLAFAEPLTPPEILQKERDAGKNQTLKKRRNRG